MIKKSIDPATPVLYLDFDGVLHHEDVYFRPRGGPFYKNPALGPMFAYVDLLSTALASLPEVKIVLSTSWVRYRGFTKAGAKLPDDIRSRIIGATFHTEMLVNDAYYSPYGAAGNRRSIVCAFDSLSRYQAIVADVARRGVENWIAIDDDIERWAENAYDRIVITQGHLGLSEPGKVDELVTRLRAMSMTVAKTKTQSKP